MVRLIGLVVVALLAAGAAQAHTFGAEGAGFVAGFAHPLGGLDHLLAMVAVGLWASQLGGRALWLVPSAFVGAMAVGGLIGMAGVEIGGIEQMILASVLVLGLVVAMAFRIRTDLAMGLVGLFALFHGMAHGLELPEASAPLGYAVGFVLATALLHGVGIAAGLIASTRLSVLATRAAGAVVALAGVGLFLGG